MEFTADPFRRYVGLDRSADTVGPAYRGGLVASSRKYRDGLHPGNTGTERSSVSFDIFSLRAKSVLDGVVGNVRLERR
jgi:hypothetical protein